jgi:hypothetical protein
MLTVKFSQFVASAGAATLIFGLAIAPSTQNPLTMGTAASAAQTQQHVRWTPSPSRGSSGSTLSGGRRGQETMCETASGQATATTVTLLVPGDQAGLLTTSDRPSFSWYVEARQPIAMKFVLQNENVAEPVFVKTVQAERSGLVSLQIPAPQTLSPGIKYRWSVFLDCQDGHGSDVFARSFIERINNQRLSAGKSALEQAAISAKAGVWYDAISPLVAAYKQNPTNSTIKTELKSLLKQANTQLATRDRLAQVIDKL